MTPPEPEKQISFATITESPGIGASRLQLSMLYTRYRFAAEFCRDREVLEVACGAGQGLGYFARSAKRVVGGDIDEENLSHARQQYAGRNNIELKKIDAHHLPFKERGFDLIVLYEAIYYLEDPRQFLRECRRVLRPGSNLILCSVNREWSDFNPSPFSKHYFSAEELRTLLESEGFRANLLGAFPVDNHSLKNRTVSGIKQAAVALHLIPKTMKGKQWLKRLFFGKLSPLPAEVVDGMADYLPPVPLSDLTAAHRFRILYATAMV